MIKVNPIRNKSLKTTVLPMAEISNGVMRYLATFIIALVVIGITPRAFCYGAEEARLLLGSQYFNVLHQAIQEAEDSVWVKMYYVAMKPDDPDNPVTILVNDLVDARKKGLDVRVILEDSLFDKNYDAYEALANGGVWVRLDSSVSLLHSKAVIIDKEILFIGSANWSKSAFYSNDEVSILIESPELASRLIEEFKKIKISETLPVRPEEHQGVRIPKHLMLEENKVPLLFSHSSEKAFDLYLLLQKRAQELGSATIPIDYEKLARDLHYERPGQGRKRTYTKFYYYFSIRQPMNKLKREYKLIEHRPWSKELTIIDFDSQQESFILPFEYWEYGLDERLSFGAKFMWLVAVLEAKESKRNPYWFKSQKDLAEKYHIGERALANGILALEREELVEVYRHVPEDLGTPGKKLANDYRLNPLNSPDEFKRRLGVLTGRYGPDISKKAQDLSAQLGEPKDLSQIETFIMLINKFGYEKVEYATSQAARRRTESGLRDISHVIDLLEK